MSRIYRLGVVAFFIAFFAVIGQSDTSRTGGARVFENPTSNGDIGLRVNIGGTKQTVINAAGATGAVSLGPSAGAVVNSIYGAVDFPVGSSTGTPTYGMRRNSSNAVEFFTNSTSAGTIDSSGNWRFGPAIDTTVSMNLGTSNAIGGTYASISNTSAFFSSQGGLILVMDRSLPNSCLFNCSFNTSATAGTCVLVSEVVASTCAAGYNVASRISCGYFASAIRCVNNSGSTKLLSSMSLTSLH